MSSTNGSKIATSADWDDAKVHTLPSGKTVELTAEPPNVFGLAARFGFSDATVALLTSSGSVPMSALVELAPAICQAMFVQPPVRVRGEDGTVPDGCVPFDRLSNDDVGYVLEQFSDGVAEVSGSAESFRGDGAGDEPGGSGENVRPKPERTGGTPRRKPARSAR